MPATATVTVQRHVLSLALVPGVTGRLDAFAERREAVLAALRPALQAARAPGGTVTVVAPALVARTATDAAPDFGASGYLPPAPAQAASGASPGGASPGGASPVLVDGVPVGRVGLHVTASAAVALVRLAGWTGAITTHEIGADTDVSTPLVTAQVLASLSAARPSPDGGLPAPRSSATAAHLVVFACAQPDGVLPESVSPALAEAERRTQALYREVVAPR